MRSPEGSLTPTVLHILLSLQGKDLHGYGIIKQVEQDSQGTLRLLTGTLYGAIKRLLAEGYISEVASDDESDPRRRYYRLTPKGHTAVTDQLSRYRLALDSAISRGITITPLHV